MKILLLVITLATGDVTTLPHSSMESCRIQEAEINALGPYKAECKKIDLDEDQG